MTQEVSVSDQEVSVSGQGASGQEVSVSHQGQHQGQYDLIFKEILGKIK